MNQSWYLWFAEQDRSYLAAAMAAEGAEDDFPPYVAFSPQRRVSRSFCFSTSAGENVSHSFPMKPMP